MRESGQLVLEERKKKTIRQANGERHTATLPKQGFSMCPGWSWLLFNCCLHMINRCTRDHTQGCLEGPS